MSRSLVVAVSLLLLAACGDGGTAEPVDRTAPSIVETTTASTAPASANPEDDGDLDDFPSVLATVTAADGSSCEVCLLAADTPERRTRGLMFVTDPELDGHDGMVFTSDEATVGAFWMRNTRLPLTAVFFDEDGVHLEAIEMEPCPDETADADCPRYGPREPFRHAVELAARTPAELLMEEGSVLTLTDRPCPDRLAGRPVT